MSLTEVSSWRVTCKVTGMQGTVKKGKIERRVIMYLVQWDNGTQEWINSDMLIME